MPRRRLTVHRGMVTVPTMHKTLPLILLTASLALSGCSVQKMAVRSLGSALSGGASTFAKDSDPELVSEALPFALKTMEALIEQDPTNNDLLLAACSGFTQYSYAYVELKGERLKNQDYPAAAHQLTRARDLYLRARNYCLQALDNVESGLSKRLTREPKDALRPLVNEHKDLIFWTAASWGSAISSGLDQPFIVIDLPSVRAIFELLLEVDESYGDGSLHDAMIALESVPEAMGGSVERAEAHYKRSLELSKNTRVGTHLSWAWLILLPAQDRDGFEETIRKAMAVNLNKRPDERLANTVNRRFAEFLRDGADDLFLDDLSSEADTSSLN